MISRIKKVILLSLSVIMTLGLLCFSAQASTASSSSTTSGFYNLYLYLGAYGAVDRTNDRAKPTNAQFADVEELLVTTQYSGGVWLRVRDSATGNAATNSSQVYYHDSWWRPGYLSGYGMKDKEYYIRGQTSSASAYDASVTAKWIP